MPFFLFPFHHHHHQPTPYIISPSLPHLHQSGPLVLFFGFYRTTSPCFNGFPLIRQGTLQHIDMPVDDMAPNILVNRNAKDPPMKPISLTAPRSARPSPKDVPNTAVASEVVQASVSGAPCSGLSILDPAMPNLTSASKVLDVRYPVDSRNMPRLREMPSRCPTASSILDLSSANWELGESSHSPLMSRQGFVSLEKSTGNDVKSMFGSITTWYASGGPAEVSEVFTGRDSTVLCPLDVSDSVHKLGHRVRQAPRPLRHSCAVSGHLPATAGTTVSRLRLTVESATECEDHGSYPNSNVAMYGQESRILVKTTPLDRVLSSDGLPDTGTPTEGFDGSFIGIGHIQDWSVFDQLMSGASTFAMLFALAFVLEKVRTSSPESPSKHS